MKAMIRALALCLFSSTAFAGLITYHYDFVVDGGQYRHGMEPFPGWGTIAVDQENRTLDRVYLSSSQFESEWIGENELWELTWPDDQPGFTSFRFIIRDLELNFYDVPLQNQSNPLLYLEQAGSVRAHIFGDHVATTGYNAIGTLTRASVFAVPEPTTLALLGLGLFGFAVKRRNN